MTSGLDEDLWIRRYQEAAGSSPRLVCFPHAGGSASYFFSLSRALAPDIEVLAIQYPGRQDRHQERSAESIAELADGTYAALRLHGILGAEAAVGAGVGSGAHSSSAAATSMSGTSAAAPSSTSTSSTPTSPPVALFGHSMGAVVAFEVGLRMQRDGLTPPIHLFASGRRAPSRHRAELAVHLLDDAGLLAELKRVGGTHKNILEDPELQQLFLPTIRQDYRAIESYQYTPGPPLTCPVTVLTGDRDLAVTPAEAAAWEPHASGRFDVRTYAGGHFFLEDHSAELIDLLRAEVGSSRL